MFFYHNVMYYVNINAAELTYWRKKYITYDLGKGYSKIHVLYLFYVFLFNQMTKLKYLDLFITSRKAISKSVLKRK